MVFCRKAPEDIFCIVCYEVRQHPAKEGAYATEKRLRTAFYGVFLYVLVKLVCTVAVELVHPDEGDHGIGKILDFLLQGLHGRFTFLPVAPAHGFHVEGGSIVEVNAEVLFLRFGFDFLEDFGLGLGFVGIFRLLVLCPEAV